MCSVLWLTYLCQPCSTTGAPRRSHLSLVLGLILLSHRCLLNPTRLLMKSGWLGSNLLFSSCRITCCQNFLCCSKRTGSGSFLKSCCIVVPVTPAAEAIPVSQSLTLSELLSHQFPSFLNLSQLIHSLRETQRTWWAACSSCYGLCGTRQLLFVPGCLGLGTCTELQIRLSREAVKLLQSPGGWNLGKEGVEGQCHL